MKQIFWSHLAGTTIAIIAAMILYLFGSAYFILSCAVAFLIVMTYGIRTFLELFQTGGRLVRLLISIGFTSLILAIIISSSRVVSGIIDSAIWISIYTSSFFALQLILIIIGRLILNKAAKL